MELPLKKLSVVFLFWSIPFLVMSQVLVSYNKAAKVDFKKYKTYQVYGLNVTTIPEFEPKKESLNFLITKIDEQMSARGCQKVKENPDLILNIGVVISAEQKTRQTDIRDAPRYMGERNYHWESQEIVVQNYNEGTVILDVVESENNKLIWQAVSKGMISASIDTNLSRITKAVKKMFNKYPVKANK
ncbi:DUF4136 domain-containing protein [Eudoraea sp.]|uniref:DUF4136 domain-containing protein n=1 Tax=Eudoraea sp. TaxID=1979955 RepID=UPI003C76AA89